MPSVVVHVRRSRPAGEVEALIDAVYRAQREALCVPATDRKIRYTEYFAIPPGNTGDYTQMETTQFPGRSQGGAPMFLSSCCWEFFSGWLVEGSIAEHGEQDV